MPASAVTTAVFPEAGLQFADSFDCVIEVCGSPQVCTLRRPFPKSIYDLGLPTSCIRHIAKCLIKQMKPLWELQNVSLVQCVRLT